MTTADQQQLGEWLRAFVEGDRSKVLAGRIEVALDRLFPEDDRFVDLVDALAAYEPGGGDLLFSYERILPLCHAALKALDEDHLVGSSGSRPRVVQGGPTAAPRTGALAGAQGDRRLGDLPPITRRLTGDGSTEFHVTSLHDWDAFEALVRYLEKYWLAQVTESSDAVYSRRWVVRSGDVPITIRYDSQIGTFFLREDGVRDESLLERIADDLARRLQATD